MKLEASRSYYASNFRCLVCDIVNQELKTGTRLVTGGEDFAAFTPYASRFPFEVFVAPRKHSSDFSETSDRDLDGLALIFKDVLARIKHALADPPFNFVLFTAPRTPLSTGKEASESTFHRDNHWHIEIIPRLTQVAGFEWGSGFFINPLTPESAARYLREVDPGI